MKHSTLTSMKFLKLKNRLRIPSYQVAGVLELMWCFAIANAQDGGIGRFGNDDIAAWLEWSGDPDELIKALVDTGWVDAHETARLVIHDWEVHCPNYVKGAVGKKGTGFLRSKPKHQAIATSSELQAKPVQVQAQSMEPSNLTKPNLTKPNQEKDNAPVGAPPPPKPSKPKFDPMSLKLPFESAAFLETWKDWIKHRIEIKEPLTETSTKQQLLKFSEWGEARSIAAIKHTVGNGWTGLREEDAKRTSFVQGRPSGQNLPDLASAAPPRPAYGKKEPTRGNDGIWWSINADGLDVLHDGETWITPARYEDLHGDADPEYAVRWRSGKSGRVVDIRGHQKEAIKGPETLPLLRDIANGLALPGRGN